MKLGVDAKRLLYNQSGLGNYSRTLVSNLIKFYPDLDITLFAPSKGSINNIDLQTFKHLHTIQPKQNFLWRYTFMNKDLQNSKIDIYHGLSNELPRGLQKINPIKKVVTIHDLIFLEHPEWYPFIDRIIYKEKFKRSCQVADKIIAISENTKKDIQKHFGIPSEKIEVIYQACSDLFYKKEKLEFPKFLGLNDRPYFLFVSSLSERKNLEIVLKALKLIPSEHRPLLVVVGSGGKYLASLLPWIDQNNLKQDVKFLDFVSNFNLKALYQHASFSIYPSLYEGFGLPVVESILCGTHVLASNTSSLPEAGLDIAHYIDPNSEESIKLGILKLMDKGKIDDQQREKIENGFNPLGLTQKLVSTYKELFLFR